MASSPSHRFGQIIGDLLEKAMYPMLAKFAEEQTLYLDKKGERSAREGKKVTWADHYGNTHDLDFVLERDGSDDKIGIPVAFIETAWRRYTKHSRNKAQEIQGAIGPLFDTYKDNCPFIGVILAGVFTDGAIQQLKSEGFGVLYFTYPMITKAFAQVKIDASFDEETPDKVFQKKVDQFNALSPSKRDKIKIALLALNKEEVTAFLNSLRDSVTRRILSITILPLHGQKIMIKDIRSAIQVIEKHNETVDGNHFVRYEIIIRYSNDDKIEAQFAHKEKAIAFLKVYQ